MQLRTQTFRSEDLVKVADAPPADDPPLAKGDKCRLVSGGPEMEVIAENNRAVKCRYGKNRKVSIFQRAVVRRI